MARNAKQSSIARTWKRAEQRGAEFFGTSRNASSGGQSGDSRSDSRSDIFFIEQKQAKSHAVYTLHDQVRPKAQKENKLPVVLLHRLGSPGFMVCIHSSDLDRFVRLYTQIRRQSSGKVKKTYRPGTSIPSDGD